MSEMRPINYMARNNALHHLGDRVVFPEDSDCWLVTTTKTIKHKDGTVRIVGYVGFDGRKFYTNRMMYEACFGAIDRSTTILTNCGNSECINPEHLKAVMHSNHKRPPIDKKSMNRIKRSLRSGKRIPYIVAKEGVSDKIIYRIKRGMDL